MQTVSPSELRRHSDVVVVWQLVHDMPGRLVPICTHTHVTLTARPANHVYLIGMHDKLQVLVTTVMLGTEAMDVSGQALGVGRGGARTPFFCL